MSATVVAVLLFIIYIFSVYLSPSFCKNFLACMHAFTFYTLHLQNYGYNNIIILYALFYRNPWCAHCSAQFPIHQVTIILNELKVEMCLCTCLALNFVMATWKVHRLIFFSFFITWWFSQQQTKSHTHTQLSYSYSNQTDLSQCRAHFKFKYKYTFILYIDLLSRCKNLI